MSFRVCVQSTSLFKDDATIARLSLFPRSKMTEVSDKVEHLQKQLDMDTFILFQHT